MLSIVITVFYNLIAIITLPLVLGFLLNAASAGDVDSWKMFKQLIFTVLIPLFIGYCFDTFRRKLTGCGLVI